MHNATSTSLSKGGDACVQRMQNFSRYYLDALGILDALDGLGILGGKG